MGYARSKLQKRWIFDRICSLLRSAAESESIAEEYESTLSLCLYCYLSLLCVEEADFCASPGNLAGKLALCREPRCARRDFTPRRAPGARQPRLRANKLIMHGIGRRGGRGTATPPPTRPPSSAQTRCRDRDEHRGART